MNTLPNGWTSAPLHEMAVLNPSRPSPPVEDDDLVSFIPMAKIEAETGRISTPEIRQWKQVKKGYTKFQQGDLLFAKITPCMENGKIAVAKGLTNGVGAGSTEFHVVRPEQDVNIDYLFYFLIQRDVRRNARMQMNGAAGQLRVPTSFLENIDVPVAPPSEQGRIVGEIEKQFSRLDAATVALKSVQANLKRYRASVLKAACEGRLVPTETELARKEGREYEPADKLLERILRERRARWEADTLAKMIASGNPPKDERWKQRYKEPLAPDCSQLAKLPEGWCWTVADQICSQVTDGEHIQPPYTASGLPMLTAKHVQDGYIDFNEFGFISDEDFAKARARCAPNENDVLIVSVGATTGRAGIVRHEDPFAIVRSVLLLRPLSNPTYLLSWVQSPLCQDWIGYASGSTAQAHFYIGDARRMPVALPPEEEQKRIVTRRDEMLSAMEALVSSISKSSNKSQGLRTSILKAAFAGGLVAQDPADEPASLLLERIRAERSVSRPKTVARRRKQELVHG